VGERSIEPFLVCEERMDAGKKEKIGLRGLVQNHIGKKKEKR
jgi:hypothetical protein